MIVALLALSVGCQSFEAALEAPYVLASGVGAARSITPIAGGALAVASGQGVFRVAGDGTTHTIGPAADAVTANPEFVFTLRGATVAWSPTPLPGAPLTSHGSLQVPGAQDLLAWTDGNVLVATSDSILIVRPGVTGETTTQSEFASQLSGLRSIALGPGPGAVLALTDRSVLLVRAGQTAEIVVQDVKFPRGAAVGRHGRIWLLHGDPATLSEITSAGLVQTARHLGQPMDMHAGTGGALAPEHLYLADAEGTVDYLPLPPAR
jgi:hypothetical protein